MIIIGADYRKLYAYLAGQIDDVLQLIAEDLVRQTCSWNELNAVGCKLKDALLTAEEMYLEEAQSHDVS